MFLYEILVGTLELTHLVGVWGAFGASGWGGWCVLQVAMKLVVQGLEVRWVDLVSVKVLSCSVRGFATWGFCWRVIVVARMVVLERWKAVVSRSRASLGHFLSVLLLS
jgi:hypothetical protein